jgi:hypothetical protein
LWRDIVTQTGSRTLVVSRAWQRDQAACERTNIDRLKANISTWASKLPESHWGLLDCKASKNGSPQGYVISPEHEAPTARRSKNGSRRVR